MMFPLPIISTSPYCHPATLEQGIISYVDGKLCCFLDETQRSIVFNTTFEPYGCYALQFWVCAIDQTKRFKVEITDGTTDSVTPYSVEPGDDCLKVLFFTARANPVHRITVRMTDLNGGRIKVERVFIEKMITAIGGECQIRVRTIEGSQEMVISANDVDPALHQVYHSTLNDYDSLVEKRLLETGEAAGRYIKICHPLDGSNAYNFIVRQNYPIIADGQPSHVHTVESWNDFHAPV